MYFYFSAMFLVIFLLVYPTIYLLISSSSPSPAFSLAEIGDFDETIDREHLAKNKYIPQQEALEDKIMEFHLNHM